MTGLFKLSLFPLDLKLVLWNSEVFFQLYVFFGKPSILNKNTGFLHFRRVIWFKHEFTWLNRSFSDLLEKDLPKHADNGLVLHVDCFEHSELIVWTEVDLEMIVESL